MDIDNDMQAIQFKPSPPPTISSLKFEIEDLSNMIESLHEIRRMRIESLLSLMFSKRAKLFELRDLHPHADVQDTIHSLDLEIQKVQRGLEENMGNIFCRSEIDKERDRLLEINLDFMKRMVDPNEYEDILLTTHPFST